MKYPDMKSCTEQDLKDYVEYQVAKTKAEYAGIISDYPAKVGVLGVLIQDLIWQRDELRSKIDRLKTKIERLANEEA